MARLKQLREKLEKLKQKKRKMIIPINKKIHSVTQMIYTEEKRQ